MQNQYYIDIDGNRDGPHDLVTIMRRIRAKKISADTLIAIDETSPMLSAASISDLAIFFNQSNSSAGRDFSKIRLLTLHGVVLEGWRFTAEHNIMTVFSGGLILMSILVSAAIVDALGRVQGVMLSWILFYILHCFYLVFSLRIYRGQPISADFMEKQIAPAVFSLIFSATAIALMIVGGMILLIIPALVVSVYYAFVPFLIMDRNMSLIEAMHASRLLVNKHNQRYQKVVTLLILAYVGSMILIVPIPLTLPIYAAALIKIYEELSAT